MTQYRIYVTNISQAISVLAEQGYNVFNGGTFVQVEIDPENKMDVIVALNKQNVVVYDIE